MIRLIHSMIQKNPRTKMIFISANVLQSIIVICQLSISLLFQFPNAQIKFNLFLNLKIVSFIPSTVYRCLFSIFHLCALNKQRHLPSFELRPKLLSCNITIGNSTHKNARFVINKSPKS